MKIRCWSCKKITELDKVVDDDDLCSCGVILEAQYEVIPKAGKKEKGVRNNP